MVQQVHEHSVNGCVENDHHIQYGPEQKWHFKRICLYELHEKQPTVEKVHNKKVMMTMMT